MELKTAPFGIRAGQQGNWPSQTVSGSNNRFARVRPGNIHRTYGKTGRGQRGKFYLRSTKPGRGPGKLVCGQANPLASSRSKHRHWLRGPPSGGLQNKFKPVCTLANSIDFLSGVRWPGGQGKILLPMRCLERLALAMGGLVRTEFREGTPGWDAWLRFSLLGPPVAEGGGRG